MLASCSGPTAEKLDQRLVSILLPLIGGRVGSSAHHLQAKVGIRRVYQGLAQVHRTPGVLSRSHGRFFTVSKGLRTSQPSCPTGHKAQESSLVSHSTSVRSGCNSTGCHGHSPPPAKASRRVSVSCTNPHNMPLLPFSAISATPTAALTLKHRTLRRESPFFNAQGTAGKCNKTRLEFPGG